MPFKHRKTLHFPVYYTIAIAIVLPLTIIYPSTVSIAVFYFLLSAAFHSWTDILGGGLEEKPWEMNSDQAVYMHLKEKWISPMYWIRYDGSPEDFLAGLAASVPALLIYNSQTVTYVIYVSLGLSLFYTLIRKKIIDWAPDFLLKTF